MAGILFVQMANYCKTGIEFICIDELMPKDHLLRKRKLCAVLDMSGSLSRQHQFREVNSTIVQQFPCS
jgi:hypothetical protein